MKFSISPLKCYRPLKRGAQLQNEINVIGKNTSNQIGVTSHEHHIAICHPKIFSLATASFCFIPTTSLEAFLPNLSFFPWKHHLEQNQVNQPTVSFPEPKTLLFARHDVGFENCNVFLGPCLGHGIHHGNERSGPSSRLSSPIEQHQR